MITIDIAQAPTNSKTTISMKMMKMMTIELLSQLTNSSQLVQSNDDTKIDFRSQLSTP
jgi:hypothetical protein